ncbi:hypothetical protein [Pseudomonas sp. NPDC090201]|uniref:hypothetical protein n=1 Tax=Pseudomonas sp. NPDC090201 TaxID=3364475 RepID=UPI00381C218D
MAKKIGPTKHVYDHKRRVNLVKGFDALSDQNLTGNEEALLKIIEELQSRLIKLEEKQKESDSAKKKTKSKE